MNIFNKVTLQGLKKNRTRTIVTIIGVILSVAMITAVTTFIASLQNNLIQGQIEHGGDWQVKFMDVDSAFAQKVTADDEVRVASIIQDIGYAELGGGQNPHKPYLYYIMGLNDTAFDSMSVHLTEGRLPGNSNEILIPEHVLSNGGAAYKIGDTLTLPVVERLIERQKAGQNTPFQDGDGVEYANETFTAGEPKNYTVVGICERPGFEDYAAPGYTVITKVDEKALSGNGSFEVLVSLKNPRNVYDYAEKTGAALATSETPDGASSYVFNRELLRYYGVSTNDNFNAVLYSLGGILIALIMIGSILLIHNSFAISVSERARQFGILSSVGATKKQLRKSVLFEGAFIGLIGIPLGLLAGVGGIGITLKLLGSLLKSMFMSNSGFSLTVSLPAMVIAATVGILTILTSAYIPARKAVKKSVIETIRQADDIKIKAKTVKSSKIVGTLFGLEGTLALKNFKRNKKRYRSTVISLFVSVVLFIAASAFGMYLTQGTEMTMFNADCDISFSASQGTWHLEDEQLLPLYDRMKTASGVYRGAYLNYLNCSAPVKKSVFTERYLEFLPNISNVRDDATCYLSIDFIDDATYQRYLDSLGLSPEEYGISHGKLIAVAKYTGYDSGLQRTINIDVFNEKSITLEVAAGSALEQWDYSPSQKLSLTIVETIPEGFGEKAFGVDAFAPYSDIAKFQAPKEAFNGLSMTFSSNDPMKSAAEMEIMMKDAGIVSGYNLFNAAEELAQTRNILLIMSIFTYGFVILISLITIANVFNTVSTSINLRRREFAMLRSVGLNNRGFNKMMNFECLFYGLKALLYGLPISAAITYLIYKAILNGVDVSFTLPWNSIAISIFSVFFVVFVTMMYAVGKIKKANVIDGLRDEIA
ncbi:MAG: ABC transporter permease [Firmicutes bacterium]|nr:ABC transporter permease [Bacillota bacterium]